MTRSTWIGSGSEDARSTSAERTDYDGRTTRLERGRIGPTATGEWMTRRGPRRPALRLAACLIVALVSAGCAGLDSPPSASPSAAASPTPAPTSTARAIRVGVSTTVGDEGWGAASLCSIRAEARLAGPVSVTVRDRKTDAAGQAADLRDLVANGSEAILVDAVDPAGLSDTVRELVERGIVVVSIGQEIPDSGAYTIATDQGQLGEVSASWLFDTLGGKGKVVAVNGPAGDPIEAARQAGFERALKAHEDMSVAATIQSKGDPSVAVRELNTLIADKKAFDGIWTPGIDSVIVDALRMADQDFVPILGSDDSAFVGLLLVTAGLRGAVVTDTPAVGGAALRLALRALDGRAPDDAVQLVAPKLWDSGDEVGRAHLLAANDPAIDPSWPLDLSVPGWTEATTAEVIACGEAPSPS